MPVEYVREMERVIVDPHGRCVPQHQLDQVGYMTLAPLGWDGLRVMALVTELVHAMEGFLAGEGYAGSWLFFALHYWHYLHKSSKDATKLLSSAEEGK